MKIKILLGLLALSFSTIFAQEVNIEFKIEGYTDSIAQLGFHQGKSMRLQDTVYFDGNGNGTYRNGEKLPQGVYFLYIQNGQWFDIIMNDDQSFKITTEKDDVIKNISIKGNEENAAFYNFMKFSQEKNNEMKPWRQEGDSLDISVKKDSLRLVELREKMKPINEEIDNYRQKIIEEHPDYFVSAIFRSMIPVEVPPFSEIEDETERNKARAQYNQKHYFDNLDFRDERFVRTHQSILFDRLEYFRENLIYPTPDSTIKSIDEIIAKSKGPEMYKFLVFYFTRAYEKSKLMCFDKVKLHMYQKYFLGDPRSTWVNNDTKTKLTDLVEKLKDNQCGNPAPSLIVPDSGGTKTPKDLTKYIYLDQLKHKYIVLYFWSATCGHCKKTTPVLDETYKRLKSKYDIEILTICIDSKDKTKEFKKYISEHNFEWIIAWGDYNYNDFRKKYNVYSTPTMYLLDTDHKIIAKDLNPEMLERIVHQKEGDPLPPPTEKKEEDEHSH